MHNPLSLKEGWPALTFQLASRLTDPICASHQAFQQVSLVDRWIQKFFLFSNGLSQALSGVITAPTGALLRASAIALQERPYLYFPGAAQEKASAPKKHFSLLSWNVCFVGGGYPITNGGVAPWPQRIDGVSEAILNQDADVVCLYETFDTSSAFALYEKLKDRYAHFYFNIGPKAVGVSSGIFVASKFAVKSPTFTPFTKEMLVGRTKNAVKGLFSFYLQSGSELFAQIHTTHLQHSEECAFPTLEELHARALQMRVVLKQIKRSLITHLPTLLTGDWNFDDEEYENSIWKPLFDRGVRHFAGQYTWGGDTFCAELEEKRPSPPLNLDHTALLNSNPGTLETYLVETGYDPKLYNEEALSDHRGLYSIISLDS